MAGDHRVPLATTLSKARFVSGTRPITYTNTWDTTFPADHSVAVAGELGVLPSIAEAESLAGS